LPALQSDSRERTRFLAGFEVELDRRRDVVVARTERPTFPVVVTVRSLILRFFRRHSLESGDAVAFTLPLQITEPTLVVNRLAANLNALDSGIIVVHADPHTGDE
jgi:hypothetical protein